VDLTAIVKKRWVMDFCRLLLERRLNITWQLPSGTRSEALDEDVLPLLYASGCRNVTYAPESGSTRVLASIKKQVKPQRLLDSATAAARLGIVARVNIVLGFPGETRWDVWQSYKLLLRAAWRGVQDSAVMIFAPYPGSALFESLVASGRLQLDEAYPYLGLARAGGRATTFNEHMSATELRWLQVIFLASFYAVAVARAPMRLLRAAFSLLSGREETQLDQFVRTRWARLMRLFGIA
jgi:anaerobic magnesium-protoporphyrin IX monomethyl ester cyclase